MRHSQPQPHHGRFDASFLHSWMLTSSECRMAEQLLSRKSIIQKAKRHHQPADSVPAAPTCVASSCALVLRYDTAARSVAVCLRLGCWICCLAAACCMHRCLFAKPDCLFVRVCACHEDAMLLMRPPTACISWCVGIERMSSKRGGFCLRDVGAWSVVLSPSHMPWSAHHAHASARMDTHVFVDPEFPHFQTADLLFA